MDSARFLIDPPSRGSWNMAVDEALLETAAETGVRTIRFYQWSPPTLSLGYFQSFGDRSLHPPSESCDVVRRASGGGAILHDRELTYSIVSTMPIGTGHNRQLFDDAHLSLIEALAEFGVGAKLHPGVYTIGASPFLCFQRRSEGDIVVGPHKVAGSAQRRQGAAILQHGSILLQQSQYAPELPGIEQAAGVQIDIQHLMDKWISLLSDRMQVAIVQDELAPQELERARIIEAQKFAHPSWNCKR